MLTRCLPMRLRRAKFKIRPVSRARRGPTQTFAARPAAETVEHGRKPAGQTPANQSRVEHASKFAAGVSLDSRFPPRHQLDDQREQCHQRLSKQNKAEPAFEMRGMKLKLGQFELKRLTIGLALGDQRAFPCLELL